MSKEASETLLEPDSKLGPCSEEGDGAGKGGNLCVEGWNPHHRRDKHERAQVRAHLYPARDPDPRRCQVLGKWLFFSSFLLFVCFWVVVVLFSLRGLGLGGGLRQGFSV